MRKLSLLALLIPFVSASLFAGGYQVRLQGQKQTGIGLIGTPLAFGAGSIFYNPGSLSFMPNKADFSIGASGIFSKVVFQAQNSDYQARTDNPMGTPFYLYGAYKITDDLSVGLGVNTPYGSSSVWNDNWDGRYLIQNISLAAIYIQPTVAYKIGDKFGIGAGLDIVSGAVEINKALPAPVNGEFNMKGSTVAFGYNIGVHFRPTEKFNIGVDYRSKIDMKVENGDTKFTEIPTSLGDYFPSSGNFDATLPLPANLDVGLSYQVTEKLMLAFEFDYVFWSAYDSLIVDFKVNNDLLADSRSPREYSNSAIFRIGGQYNISDKIIARAGFYYDPTPTNEDYFSPETVSLDQFGWTVGLSLMPVKGLSIDLSYLQLSGKESVKMYKPDNFGGTYKSMAFIPGLGVSYSF